MDEMTNIQELKNKIGEFCRVRDWEKYHGAKDLAIGIITEASELLEQFRFKSEAEIEDMFKSSEKSEKIYDEVADVFYFVLRFSQKYNFDLSIVLNKKMEQNSRKYPVEKARGSNKKYDEL